MGIGGRKLRENGNGGRREETEKLGMGVGGRKLRENGDGGRREETERKWRWG